MLDLTYQAITTIPRPYTQKIQDVDWKAVIEGLQRRPRAVSYSAFVGIMPLELRSFLRESEGMERKQRLQWLRRWLDQYALSEIGKAISDVASRSPVSLEHVEHQL
ncbi:hypothetical protein [Heliophilum fasciatum]|uniref:Uncharacterized protein n=1 Tax=Heliophilum fasciatum TaxID=35700 RepID=A0A4R2RC65_9FIRM|nr:hypothetical protein [Heliophilum fasciatum]MCW2279486.1 hypothetical protein [Heliophilum fasciatum]TCP59699.1 hypothetical protein EDD73_1519 [Heliophilum fasciatum]